MSSMSSMFVQSQNGVSSGRYVTQMYPIGEYSTNHPPAFHGNLQNFTEFIASRQPHPPAKRPPPVDTECGRGPEPASKLPKVALGALRSSLTTGVFVDCQFTLYSRRTADGEGVDTPLAIYASSRVLKDTSDYFESLIAGGFSEGIGGPIAKSKKPCPPSQIPATEYEYDSDSDLEDEPETNPLPSSSTSELGAALYDYQQDRLVDHKGHVERTKFTTDQHNRGIATTSSAATQHNIIIPDVAFKTFQAFVYYAYTGDIQFAPLSSIEPSPANDAQAAVSVQSDASFACSPKSMYRLADKYGLNELKELALKNIRSQLAHAPSAILPELFSHFSSRYPQVMTVLAKLVCASVRAQPQGEGTSQAVCLTGLREWTDRVARGELPHAGPVLAELITVLAAARP